MLFEVVLMPIVVHCCIQEPEFMILLEEVAALSQLVQEAARAVVGPGRGRPLSRGIWRSSSRPAGSVRHSRGATAPAGTTAGIMISKD